MIQIYKKVKDCPGGFHSYFLTNIGIIRKPNASVKITKQKVITEPIAEIKPSITFFGYLWQIIKKVWQTIIKVGRN